MYVNELIAFNSLNLRLTMANNKRQAPETSITTGLSQSDADNRIKEAIGTKRWLRRNLPGGQIQYRKNILSKRAYCRDDRRWVNDSPPLKQAEVGIAVSPATDVAEGAASIVLTDEGLSAILAPITVGRKMFQRINTWVLNKITGPYLKPAWLLSPFGYSVNTSFLLGPS